MSSSARDIGGAEVVARFDDGSTTRRPVDGAERLLTELRQEDEIWEGEHDQTILWAEGDVPTDVRAAIQNFNR